MRALSRKRGLSILNISKKQIVILGAFLGLCVWGFLIYSNTFKAPFLFDDDEFILKNPAVRQLGDRALWKNPDYRKRFVAFFSFALNYRVHGNDVTGYHLVNIAVHLFMALSVCWFFMLLLRTPRMREDRITKDGHLLAFLIGWLFVSHPIQTEAVTYISQRFECLASLFYMLSLCCFLAARMDSGPAKRIVFFTLSAAAAILGGFTKETIFTLPASMMLLEWIFLKAENTYKPFWKQPWVYIGAVFSMMAVVFFFFLYFPLREIFSAHADMGITSGIYLLTQFRVVLRYIGLLFMPMRQNMDYDLSWSSGLPDGATFLSGLAILGILLLAFRSIRRFPLIGFGLIWFFVTLSITSSFVPLKDAMVEHRLYLPSVGFFIAFCAGGYYLIKNFKVFFFGIIGVIFICSLLTYRRNKVWADDLVFWQDVVSKSPQKARPHVNLGVVYRKRGEYQKAIEAYQLALKLHPKQREPVAKIYNNLGAVYGKRNNFREEIYFCLKAIELDPGNYQAYSNLGYAYALTGDFENALKYGQEAVKISPRFDEGWNNLGVTHGLMGHYQKAAKMFRRALKSNPRYQEAEANLRLALDLMKK